MICLYKSSFENKSRYRELLEKSPAKQQNILSFGDEMNPVLVIYSLFKVGVRGRTSLRLNCFSRSLHHDPGEPGARNPPLYCKVACSGSRKDGLRRGHPCSDTSEGGKKTER